MAKKKQQALFWSSFCSRWTPDLCYSPFCFVCDRKRSVRSGARNVLVTTALKKMQQPGSCGCEKVIITPVTLTPSEEVNPTLHYHRNMVGFLLPFSHLPFANPKPQLSCQLDGCSTPGRAAASSSKLEHFQPLCFLFFLFFCHWEAVKMLER